MEAPLQREVKEEEARRCGRKRGEEESPVVTRVGGYNGSASSGALESPDTPSNANAARTRLSSARRSSIRRDIAIHTSGGTLFTARDFWSERGSNDYEGVYTLFCLTAAMY